MLKKLIIENYALINHLELEFGEGFTIITGETGAGKSIMLGALSLLKGGRADTKVVADKDSKSIVEAKFISKSLDAKRYVESQDLDWCDGEIIVRREISANGRSRAFINDTPVNLAQLGSVTEKLIDIHSQYENRMLAESDRQLEIIDIFSDNGVLKEQYHVAFIKALKLRNKIKAVKRDFENIKARRSVVEYQFNILQELAPKVGELEEIERKYELGTRADELRSSLGEFISYLEGEESGAIDMLYKASAISHRAGLEKLEPNLSERLSAISVELRDIISTSEDALESMEIDSDLIEKLSERMNLYYDAMRQFRVEDAAQLVKIHEELREELNLLDGGDSSLGKLEAESKEANRELKRLGDQLSQSRAAGAGRFVQLVEKEAMPMGLPNLKFSVVIEQGKFTPGGQDIMTFLAGFNKNREAGPIEKIASGGELSRLMLAIKSVLSSKMKMPTIIFDEVDTGVSGEIADKMGDMMLGMAKYRQVMTITHLPQVAAKGTKHFKVYKTDDADRTQTHVKELDAESRVREIAAMISGKDVGEAALENARQLLKG